jgi:hypothetical protein
MLQTFKNGQGSVVLRVKLLDSSATTGAGLTGLTSASSGLIISTIADNEATAVAYTVAGATIETITTLGTYAAPTASKCRFKEVDATNHKGVYEIQIADARFAVASAKSLIVSIAGATNLAQADFVVQLQSDDPYIAKPTNYASLVIDGSGRVDVSKIAGTAQTGRDIGASVLVSSGTGTGQISITSGVVSSNITQIGGSVPALTGFKQAVLGNVVGTVGSASSTTSIVTSALTPAGAATDQFKGRIITFDQATTTVALRGQSTDITASTNSATPTFTVTALTTAPVSGDTFSIT